MADQELALRTPDSLTENDLEGAFPPVLSGAQSRAFVGELVMGESPEEFR